MMVELIKHPTAEDWAFCYRCTLETIGKNPSKAPTEEWKRRILEARHSPIRTLQFAFELTDIPYWVSVHLVRHVHAQPFVRTQRNDRQTQYDRGKAPQDAPVNMIWYMNAEALMTIANKRLCAQASEETRAVVREMCKAVLKVCPEFDKVLVPMCEYHGGVCHEFFSCKRAKND